MEYGLAFGYFRKCDSSKPAHRRQKDCSFVSFHSVPGTSFRFASLRSRSLHITQQHFTNFSACQSCTHISEIQLYNNCSSNKRFLFI